MRGLRAKFLMNWARKERAGEKDVVEREIAQRGTRDATVVNVPWSIRALYLRFKAEWLRRARFSGVSKAPPKNGRKRADTFKMKDDRPAAVIQKPLEYILGNCPPTQKKDPITGQDYLVLHPTYVRARHAADRGDGTTVKRIAASFA